MNTVLFACIHNAGRSQMAAAWFNALADPSKARAISAGTQPGARVHPEVSNAMREVGIDLEGIAPRLLTDELARTASMLVTMGCGEACPVVPGLRRADWPLEDPKGKPIARVREIREEARSRVVDLLETEQWRRPISFEPARPTDREAVLRLLAGGDLPTDVGDDFPSAYLVARAANEIIGCAGLEEHGDGALLRSVAVHPAWRSFAIARRLVAQRLESAKTDVYLLTTNASDYFRRFGFEECPRNQVPAGIAASGQLTGTTCSSAACLVRRNAK